MDLPKNLNSPKIMRELYNSLKADCDNCHLYPEQFDVTFDFIPRMCVKRNCEICFFGKNGIEKLCSPKDGKWCSVALTTGGYMHDCFQDCCDIYNNIENGKGLCNGPHIFNSN